MTNQVMIIRNFHDNVIRQRSSDGYLDATAMCKANGKKFNDYYRLKSTKEFLTQLSDFIINNPVTGMCVTEQNQQLIQTVQGGTPEEQGTWVHPYISINLAQWCSPIFAVMVTNWMFELLTKGSVSLKPEPTQEIAEYVKINADILEGFGITGTAKQNALNNSIKDKFGYDVLDNLNTKAQPTELQQSESLLLIPSDIAKRTGLRSARQVNLKLIELKLQTPYRDSKKRLHYKLTDLGLKHGTYQDKSYNSSRPVRSIKWYESVLELF
ncbi:KilA-N domain-containing protein [Candidatus Halobeggiatoa sp. HSG11]|nr:KilA-N domain-containing protein [Candidatus Halobeggiatoa sp. HSG11]